MLRKAVKIRQLSALHQRQRQSSPSFQQRVLSVIKLTNAHASYKFELDLKQSSFFYTSYKSAYKPRRHYLTSTVLYTEEEEMAENRFMADYAKLGTSGCKKCKQKLPKGSLRLAKVVSNPFSEEGGDMKQYHHPSCLFETFLRARATTKIIEEADDIEGFSALQDDDKKELNRLIQGYYSM